MALRQVNSDKEARKKQGFSALTQHASSPLWLSMSQECAKRINQLKGLFGQPPIIFHRGRKKKSYKPEAYKWILFLRSTSQYTIEFQAGEFVDHNVRSVTFLRHCEILATRMNLQEFENNYYTVSDFCSLCMKNMREIYNVFCFTSEMNMCVWQFEISTNAQVLDVFLRLKLSRDQFSRNTKFHFLRMY